MAAARSGLDLAQTTCYQAEQGRLRAFIDFAAPRLSARLRNVARAIA